MLTCSTRSAGYSLVELMIATTIGFIVMAWMTDYLSAALTDHTTTLQRNLLNQEFQVNLGIMDRELRRAGSWADAVTSLKKGPTNPFTIAPHGVSVGAKTGEAGASCITFSYDLNSNKLLDRSMPDERYGFRLNQGQVEMRVAGVEELDCNLGTWNAMNSPAVVVDTLTFHLTGSACVNLTRSGADCGVTPPTKGDQLLWQRLVTVAMSGHLKQKPALQRSDARTVTVRNQSLETAP